MPNIVEMYENLLGGKAIYKNQDGSLMDSDNEIINTGGEIFKNRIINGDMSVSQRGVLFYVENEEKFTSDRWVSSTSNDNKTEVIIERIYSSNEGELLDSDDPFEDDSQISCYQLNDDTTDLNDNHDGQWKDSDGNDIDGQYDNGKWDKSAKFDGNSYIDLGYEFNDSKDLSISLWFNPTNLDNDNAMIHLSKDGENTFIIASHWSDDTNFAVSLNNNSYAIDFDLETNTWYHAVYTTNGKVYVNGNLINTFDETVDATTFNKNAIIGADRDTDDSINDFYEGYIDQVRIFNRILSSDEVKKLYVESKEYFIKPHSKVTLINKSDTYSVTPYEYRFEGQHLRDILTNKEKATLSFEFASSVNQDYYARIYYPDGTLYEEEKFTYDGDGKFQTHSITFDFKDIDLDKVDIYTELGLVLTICENDEINESDWFKLTNVQFEKGSIATGFGDVTNILTKLLCLRYFQKDSDSFISVFGRTKPSKVGSDYEAELPGRNK